MPIFIVGFARSGTTLCQKLVSQHLGVPTLPETHYFEFLEDHEPAGGFIRPDAARELLGQLDRFLQIDVAALKPLLSRDEIPIRPLFLHLVGQQIGSQPLADKGLWIEKTPGHAEHLERIYQMFPKARFLCMVRDPVHSFASRRELQSTGRGWGEAWKPIEAFCAQWAEHVRNFRAFSERHPGQLMTIRLEDLAANPNAELVRVSEFLGPGFATPIDAPRHPDIIQPFETWKRDALKPADSSIAERAGKGLLDEYETWRVKTLLRETMAAFGYPVETQEPPGLDPQHRRMVASLDWYVEQFARRDALMDVKTTRIRNLLNELAERNSAAADATMPPRPVASTLQVNPLLVARVGAPARNDATAPADDVLEAPARAFDVHASQTTRKDVEGGAARSSTSALGRQSSNPAGQVRQGATPAAAGDAARPGGGPASAGAAPRPGSALGGGAPPRPGTALTGGGLPRPGIGRTGGGVPGPGGVATGGAVSRPGAGSTGGGVPESGALSTGSMVTTSSTAPAGTSVPGPGAALVGRGVAPRPGGTPAGGDAVARAGSAATGGGAMPRPGGPKGQRVGNMVDTSARPSGPPAGAAQAGKPGLRAGLKAGGRGRPGGRGPGMQTHAQRQGRNYVVDDDGPLDDNLPAVWRPLTLHGISGVNDNGDTFLAEAAEIIARRAAQTAGRGGGEIGDDITDAADNS